MSRNKKETIILSIYLILFLGFAITMALLQPLADVPPLYGNPPDEHARFLIPQYIYEHGKLPTGLEEELRIKGYGFSYGLYNAFPYYVQGFVMRFVGIFTDSMLYLLYAARMVNVIFGLIMAIMVYKIGREVFEDNRARWLFCFAVTFLPQNLFMHTYVNSDSSCLMAISLMVYALIRGYKYGFELKTDILLSAGIILSALSYYNAYGYILCSILLFLGYYVELKDGKLSFDWKKLLKNGLLITVLVLLGIGWYFVRSYILYDGDILGLATRDKMAEAYLIEEAIPEKVLTYQDMDYGVGNMIRDTKMVQSVFLSFVGVFGSMKIPGSAVMYTCYRLLFTLGGVGILLAAINAMRQDIRNGKWQVRKMFFHLNMWICIVIPFVLLIYYAYTIDYQSQGRYVLPILVPFMYYVVRGIKELTEIHWKELTFPQWLVDAAYVTAMILIIGFTAYMIYFKAVPIYLETGVVF